MQTQQVQSDPLIGTLLSERYRIDALLGEGGMGRVYQAEHTLMKKRLAIKVLRAELGVIPEIVTRFEREALAAAHIEHPNVVAATDFGKTPDGSLFLVMEHVDGPTLTEALAAGRMSIARAVHVAEQILRALVRAHGMGIVHRDLKPDNMHLVEREGDCDFVKVLDFGIAKISIGDVGKDSGAPLTQVGLVYGTPEYMAPEQALGQPVDPRADLYAVGVILYEMLAGRLPFIAEDKVQLLGMHIGIEPEPISSTCPEAAVPAALDSFVLSMLSKKRDDRPADATAALEAMAAACEGVVVESGGASNRDGPISVRLPAAGRPTGPQTSRLSATFVRAATQLLPVVAAGISTAETRAGRIATGLRVAYRKDPRRGRIVLGTAAGAVFLIFLIWAVTGGDDSISTSPGGATSSPGALPPAVAQEVERDLEEYKETPEVKAALSKLSSGQAEAAIQELEALRTREPGNARIAYLLGTIYADQERHPLAIERYSKALELDTRLRADATLRADALAALSSRPASEDAIRLLATHIGDAAQDELVAMAVEGPSKTGRANARKALTRMGSMQRLPPWAQKVLALSEANRCDEKRAIIVELGAIGDRRALPTLERLPRRGGSRGCGFLGMEPCPAPCYVNELRETLRQLGGSADDPATPAP